MDRNVEEILERILDLSYPSYMYKDYRLERIQSLASEALSLTSNHLVKERL